MDHRSQARLRSLLNELWKRYRSRMEYVRRYEQVVRAHRGRFQNDHIAFRTIAHGPHGIHSISRVFEALGYAAAACYEFPDKKLSSIHYQHKDEGFPKIFISQLKAWELSPRSRAIVAKTLKSHRPALPDGAPSLERCLAHFRDLPWALPQRKDVEALNRESQFGAWVLLNGYEVNHFTASVDAHGVAALDTIEKTVSALRAARIPMKAEIEGAPGSPLRQSSTEAVILPAKVRAGGKVVEIPWTYAYFELAERPQYKDPKTGRLTRFEGFFGAQATNLFDMTKVP